MYCETKNIDFSVFIGEEGGGFIRQGDFRELKQ